MLTFSWIPMDVPQENGWRVWWRRWRTRTLGAVTTFRWYFSGQKGGFWSALASAWNAPIVTFLGDHHNNFCWGGGTAIRRERFEEIRAFDFWQGSVSDDFSMTHALRQAKLFHSFCTGMSGAHDVRLRCGIAARIHESSNDHHACVRAETVVDRRLRARAVLRRHIDGRRNVLRKTDFRRACRSISCCWRWRRPCFRWRAGCCVSRLWWKCFPEWKSKLLADGWIWTLLAAVVPFLSLWNTVVAMFTRTIRWRGIRYQLLSHPVRRASSCGSK